MRAAVLGLVGVLLAGGGAEASECRARHMMLVKGRQSFKVNEVSHSTSTVSGLLHDRMIFRGTMNGRSYIIDMQGIQGSTGSLVSYVGHKPENGLKPKWGSKPEGWVDGSDTMILAGPIKGNWRAVCR